MEVHRGRRGANLKHRARDALGLADLRQFRTSTSLDIARCRGPWVRWTLWRPARPRYFSSATRLELEMRLTPGRPKNRGDDARLQQTQPSS